MSVKGKVRVTRKDLRRSIERLGMNEWFSADFHMSQVKGYISECYMFHRSSASPSMLNTE